MISGGVFTFILKLVLSLPIMMWVTAMLPVVAIVGLVNGIVTQVLYTPVRRLFFMQGGKKDE